MSGKEFSSEAAQAYPEGYIQPISTKDSTQDSAELDENYQLYKNADAQDFDAAEAKRVLRKIDLRIIPVLFVTYLLQVIRILPTSGYSSTNLRVVSG